MPKDIYNIGRTVGLSAWEVYVRQSLLLNPEIEPLSEREWLSDSIGMGTSMLLKIPAGTSSGWHDYRLPENSLLCAPNTIIGSLFLGVGEEPDATGWCKFVSNYGQGVVNDVIQPGYRNASELPEVLWLGPSSEAYLNSTEWSYTYIRDGIFLQNGTWEHTERGLNNFLPDLTTPPLLRLLFSNSVEEDFYLLLSGFVTRAIVKGEVGYDMGPIPPISPEEQGNYHPENGDYLGPELFPWSSKVIFIPPQGLSEYMLRNMVSTSDNLSIEVDPNEVNPIKFHLSKIVGDFGINVAETSETPVPKIVVSSLIKSRNEFLRAEQMSKYDHTQEKSINFWRLTVSAPVPGKGIALERPSEKGDPYIISAPIDIHPDYSSWLSADQSEGEGTVLKPTVIEPGLGVSLGGPNLDLATNKHTAYLSSVITTDGPGAEYLNVEQISHSDPDAIEGDVTPTTILSPSKIRSGLGISMKQPLSGSDVIISANMNTEGCGAKYLQISQQNSDVDPTIIGSTFKPSKLSPVSDGAGISITQPQNPGDDIKISAKIALSDSSPLYAKIEQYSNDTGCGCGTPGCVQGEGGADAISTKLTFSHIITNATGGILDIRQPQNPGDSILILDNLKFTPGLGINLFDGFHSNGDPSWEYTGTIDINAQIGTDRGYESRGIASENYIEVHQPGYDGNATTLKLSTIRVASSSDLVPGTPAELVNIYNDMNDMLQIEQPTKPGDPIKFLPTVIRAGVGINIDLDPDRHIMRIKNAYNSMWSNLSTDNYDLNFEDHGFFFVTNDDSAGEDPEDRKALRITQGEQWNAELHSRPFASTREFWENSSIQPLRVPLYMDHQISIDKSKKQITSARFKIHTSQDGSARMYFGGNICDPAQFQFRHGSGPHEVNSTICSLEFKNTIRIDDDIYDLQELNDPNKYQLYSLVNGSTGIWNLCTRGTLITDSENKFVTLDGWLYDKSQRDPNFSEYDKVQYGELCEASWDVTCNVFQDSNGSGYYIDAVSISDGFNGQYGNKRQAIQKEYYYRPYELTYENKTVNPPTTETAKLLATYYDVQNSPDNCTLSPLKNADWPPGKGYERENIGPKLYTRTWLNMSVEFMLVRK